MLLRYPGCSLRSLDSLPYVVDSRCPYLYPISYGFTTTTLLHISFSVAYARCRTIPVRSPRSHLRSTLGYIPRLRYRYTPRFYVAYDSRCCRCAHFTFLILSLPYLPRSFLLHYLRFTHYPPTFPTTTTLRFVDLRVAAPLIFRTGHTHRLVTVQTHSPLGYRTVTWFSLPSLHCVCCCWLSLRYR